MMRIRHNGKRLLTIIFATGCMALALLWPQWQDELRAQNKTCPPQATITLTGNTMKEMRGVTCEVALALSGSFGPCSSEKRGNEEACRQYCMQGEARCEGETTTPAEAETVGCTERTETFGVTAGPPGFEVIGEVSTPIATITCGGVVTDCGCIDSSFIFQ
jgi:hypothetical protein